MNRVYRERDVFTTLIYLGFYHEQKVNKYIQMFSKVYCFLARASHFVGWSRKLKVHRANLRTISSYSVRSSIDTVHNNIFFFGVFLFLFSFVYFPLGKHIYFNEEFFSKTLFACFLDKQLYLDPDIYTLHDSLLSKKKLSK